MKEKVESIVNRAQRTADTIKSFPGRIRLVSHYDCDGISSAAIMVRALVREGKDFRLSFINQLSEDFLKEVANEETNLVVLTDLGSGYIELINRHLASDGRKVIVADHHQIEGKPNDNLIHLNPMEFGIDENISGSGVSYLIARCISPENMDLSQLGIIGAIGDSQTGAIEDSWGLAGFNREILKDAERSGKMRVMKGLRLWGRYTRPLHKALEYSVDPYIPGISGSESGSIQLLHDAGISPKREGGKWRTLAGLSSEEVRRLSDAIIKERMRNGQENPEWIFGDVYELLDKGDEFRDANEFATLLNACGKMKRAYLGVALCLNDPGAFGEVKDILEAYRKEIGRALEWLRRNISNPDVVKASENAYYLIFRDSVSEHIVSNVISIVSRSEMLSDRKPVFAYAYTDEGSIKISARASDAAVASGLNLKSVLNALANKFGGEGGGHAGAAGATVPKEVEGSFINSIEDIILSINKTGTTSKDGEMDGGSDIDKAAGEKGGRADREKKGQGDEDSTGEETGKKVERKGLVRYLVS